MTRVLITGAGGFIGSHVTQVLLAQGHEIRALVHYTGTGSVGWLSDLPIHDLAGVEIMVGDVRDAAQMRKAVAHCSIVYHLAALIAIPYSYDAPSSYIETNVGGTLNLLEAARDAGVERFIQTSSSEVYGTAQFVPMTELHPLSAQSPYAASKIGADQLALSFHRSFGLPVSVIRPFNTFGPRQSARAVVSAMVGQLITGQEKVVLGSLSPTRDFTFVKDTAAAFYAVACSDRAIGEIINIGSGFEISIGELFTVIRDIVGSSASIEPDYKQFRPKASEVNRLWADLQKAHRLLEWRPEYSGRDGLRRGLVETVAWFQERRTRAQVRQGCSMGAVKAV